MAKSTRIEPNMLHLLCLAVLVLSGCGGKEDKQNITATATLFAGNPHFEGSGFERPLEGQGLLDDPPLGWESLLFVGEKLVTHTEQELWYTDLTATKPVIKRLAGRETPGRPLNAGSCSSAHLVNIRGIAVKTDGSVVGVDQTGNTIFAVNDPFGPNCTVTLLAGTTTAQDAVPRTVNGGDIDGPGVSARFWFLEWPAVIDDNIYVIDEGEEAEQGQNTSKLKRLANDAANTVTTVTNLPVGIYSAMIALHGKLYALGHVTERGGFIIEIDPATGAIREIIRGRSSSISGLATDGNGLFLYDTDHPLRSWYLLYVTLDGQVKRIEVSPQYRVRLRTHGVHTSLAFHNNAVYLSALADGTYVERIVIP